MDILDGMALLTEQVIVVDWNVNLFHILDQF